MRDADGEDIAPISNVELVENYLNLNVLEPEVDREDEEGDPQYPEDMHLPTPFGVAVWKQFKAPQVKKRKAKQILFNMTDYVQQAVDHYKKLSGTPILQHAKTPYCPKGSSTIRGGLRLYS